MKIIFILDALRFKSADYLSDHINLDSYIIDVLPPFSFEPDAAYLCGLYPEESNAGMKIWKRKHKNNNFIFDILNYIPFHSKIYRQLLNKLLKIINVKDISDYNGNIGCIPFNLLKYFELSESNNLFQRSKKGMDKTIFDSINSDYSYTGVPFSSGMLESIKNKFNFDDINKLDYHFFYISDLDKTGHRYGGSSIEYFNKIKEISNFINSIINSAEKYCNNINFMIFGDHGMVDINKIINIEEKLIKLNLKIEKDYIYFLDSTVARFWFYNDNAKQKIINCLSNNQYGSWITAAERNEYHINYKHNKYGDEIWWANDGVLISPNFWQSTRKLKGMHGYRNNSLDNHTCMLTNNQDILNSLKEKSIDMVELNKLIIKFLDNR